MRKLTEPGVNSARFDYYLTPENKQKLREIAAADGRQMNAELSWLIQWRHEILTK